MNLRHSIAALLAFGVVLAADASWYWPFDGKGDKDNPRLSELMEPATTNIDAAADFAAEGKVSEAVESYQAALKALDVIEQENPERAATAEFATLRNKRAYVKAAIDSLLLGQARDNAKAVAVTDTTELEKKIRGTKATPKLESQLEDYVDDERERRRNLFRAAEKARMDRVVGERIEELLEDDPQSYKARLLQAGELLRKGDVDGALKAAKALLEKKPNDAGALNLQAACEAANGDLISAEWTLEQTIEYNPNEYHAYYNLADINLQRGKKSEAARLYAKGRELGGPEVAAMEKLSSGGKKGGKAER